MDGVQLPQGYRATRGRQFTLKVLPEESYPLILAGIAG